MHRGFRHSGNVGEVAEETPTSMTPHRRTKVHAGHSEPSDPGTISTRVQVVDPALRPSTIRQNEIRSEKPPAPGHKRSSSLTKVCQKLRGCGQILLLLADLATSPSVHL